MSGLQRFNLSGLEDATEELAGPQGRRLPIAFGAPDGTLMRWARLSIEMVPSLVEGAPPYRALVIRPVPD